MATLTGARLKTTRETALEQAQADSEKMREGAGALDPEALRKALAVMVLAPNIREYLTINDPQALKQAREALGLKP